MRQDEKIPSCSCNKTYELSSVTPALSRQGHLFRHRWMHPDKRFLKDGFSPAYIMQAWKTGKAESRKHMARHFSGFSMTVHMTKEGGPTSRTGYNPILNFTGLQERRDLENQL